jgi:CRP-like cAMP-binding protein
VNDALSVLSASVGDMDVALLLPHLQECTLVDGEVLFRDGVACPYLYFLVDGQLAVIYEAGGAEIELGTRGPGAWLGEVGLIDGGPATATVISRGKGRALRMDHARLVELTSTLPDVASCLLRHVSKQMGERIAESNSGILEQVRPGHLRVRKPEEVRSWAEGMLGWLINGEEP